ncbi:MAG: hypothetical protein HY873_06560 [Chloroflexi bacterium]|nr:hypothetical protein [Chloroflexota bacterium]
MRTIAACLVMAFLANFVPLLPEPALAEDPGDARVRTTLEVAAPAGPANEDGGAMLSARLSAEDGRPLGGARVTFYELSTVFGERLMELGEAMTDTTGTAALVLEPAWPGEHSIIARFGGGEGLEPAQATLLLQTDAPPNLHENAAFGLEQPRKWAPFGFGLLVLAVWGVLGLVMARVVLGIMADAPAPAPGAVPVRIFSRGQFSASSAARLLAAPALLLLTALPVGWFLTSGGGGEPDQAAMPGSSHAGASTAHLPAFPATLEQSISAITTDASGDVRRDSADFPSDLALVDGRVLVLDSNKGRMLTVTSEEKFARTFESNRGGETSLLRAVAMTSHLGLIYIAAPLYGNVVVLEPSGRVDHVIKTRIPAGIRPFHPAGVAVDESDNIWISDSSNDRVVSLSPSGSFLASIGDGDLDTPGGLALDAAGNLWVVDSGHHQVKQYAPGGLLLTAIGADQLKKPEAVAVDESGTVFVSDAGLRAVAVFGIDGLFLGVIAGDQPGHDGEMASALPYPYGVKVASDRLYVVDRLSGVHVFRLDGASVREGER